MIFAHDAVLLRSQSSNACVSILLALSIATAHQNWAHHAVNTYSPEEELRVKPVENK